MTKSKHPFLYFGIFSVAVQAVMWVLFCLYDYGIDERHWVSSSFNYTLEDVIAYAVLIIILLLPIVSYFLLSKKKFSSGKPIKDTLIQIPCWCAIAFAISYPIFQMVNYDKWIIAQKAGGSGGVISLNGLEYLALPFIEGIFAVVLLLRLIVVAVKGKIRSNPNK